MENSKKKRFIKNGWFFKISWIVFVSLVSVLLSKFIMTSINDMLAVGRHFDTVQIEIPEDSSLSDIARILKSKNVISEEWFFKLYAVMTKSPKNFSAGIYELETNMDYQSIINHIRNKNNIRDVVEVTITEGMNVIDCANLMEKNNICDKEEFLKCCSSEKFNDKFDFLGKIKNDSKRIYKLDGYLFPDTYKFYKGEKATDVVTKLLGNFQKKIYKKPAFESRSTENIYQLAENQNIELDKLINLASIIQAEAANKEDMFKISSVINNRLATIKNGGRNKFGEFTMNLLRIDATRYYPYKTEASIPGDIKKSFTSSYNTYKFEGLPPGPICSPGFDAIEAALFPDQTDYFYYCHNQSGETFFARTNQVHLSNMKKAGLS